MKALFLDRDGTLIVDKHYQSDAQTIEYVENFFEAMQILQNKGFKCFIVTNQSGINRGIFAEQCMHDIHAKINQDLISHQLEPIIEFAYCPHSPDENCVCRKPSGKMILDLIQKYNINQTESYMLGDRMSDVQAGKNAHVNAVLLGKSANYPLCFKNLYAFSLWEKLG